MTGSSAARLMLLSRMKKRMRLVKMLWLTILWHVILNLQKGGREKVETVKETHGRTCELSTAASTYLLVWLKTKKARASGMGTTFSFS